MGQGFVRNSVEILGVHIRDDNHASWIMCPPFGRDKRSGDFIAIDNVLAKRHVVCARNHCAKRTRIFFWLVQP